MIKKFILENYKSIKKVELELAGLNFLLGPNNSGKSSFLESILLMKKLFSYPFKSEIENIKIKEIENKTLSLVEILHNKNKNLNLKLGCSVNKNKLITEVIELSFKNKDKIIFDENRNLIKIVKNVSDMNLNLMVEFFASKGLSILSIKKRFNNLNESIKNIYYLRVNRNLIKSRYEIPKSLVKKQNAKIEDAFDIFYFIKERLEYNECIKSINELINKYNLNNIRFIPQENHKYSIVVDEENLGLEINIAELGSGIANLIPFLILFYYYPKNSLILLELPEIHMHPKMQDQFSEILIDIIKTKGHQFIIETHSDHLIFNILNKIVLKKLNRSEVNILYFSKINGITEIKKLEITEKGTIKGGLSDFFESEFNNLVEWMSAISKE
ncbi:MAG: AAA family ATPase [Candidatus Helarchaeota archaeon]